MVALKRLGDFLKGEEKGYLKLNPNSAKRRL